MQVVLQKTRANVIFAKDLIKHLAKSHILKLFRCGKGNFGLKLKKVSLKNIQCIMCVNVGHHVVAFKKALLLAMKILFG